MIKRETYRPRLLPTKKANASNKPTNGIATHSSRRGPTQLRPIKMKVNTISHAAGSAYVETDSTKVICGIYGPRQSSRLMFSSKGILWCDVKFAPFANSGSRIDHRDISPKEKNYSNILSDTLSVSIQLDKFPKSKLEAYVCVLQTESMSSTLCASIICVSLALANAGIEMYGLVSACSAALVNETPILEPSMEQLTNSSSGSLCLAYMSTLNQITHVQQTGMLNLVQTKSLFDLCTDGCEMVHSLMQDCLLKHYQIVQTSKSCQNLAYNTPQRPNVKEQEKQVKRQKMMPT